MRLNQVAREKSTETGERSLLRENKKVITPLYLKEHSLFSCISARIMTSSSRISPTSGVLFGLGVGPGDPELITLKSLRILQQTPIIAYPASENGESFARSIISEHLLKGRPEKQIEIPIRLPFVALDRAPAQRIYDQAAAVLAEHLSAGENVALLCEGDPFFYGSFQYLFERLAPHHPIEVVPGITSFTASAAALGMPLTARNDVLTVLPGPLDAEDLRERLLKTEAAVIMKIGRHFSKIRAVLEEIGLVETARYIERATLPNQRILPLHEIDPETVPYFSMILVHRKASRRQAE
ncbi:Precorrin-2 C(20)-methyltransferase [Azospirillaceae bacterium]